MRGLGQRGHSWGNPDWDKIALTRTVGAWFDDGTGVVLGDRAPDQGRPTTPTRRIWGAVLDAERALAVEEPRLSTTTDEAGRQIRAGLELWVDKDDDYPLRGVGEVLAGSTLELGALRLDVAFFALAHRGPHRRSAATTSSAARVIKAVVTDFGGVITLPLIEAFKRAHAELGIPIEALGTGDGARRSRVAASRRCGRSSAARSPSRSSSASWRRASSEVLGRPVDLDGYGARLMGELEPNEPLLDYYRSLRDERGVRLAILTNNVREWHDVWRPRFAIDELFELVVDSGFEGTRKPEPEIYARTLERLGLPGEACAFVDDVEVNVTAARAARACTASTSATPRRRPRNSRRASSRRLAGPRRRAPGTRPGARSRARARATAARSPAPAPRPRRRRTRPRHAGRRRSSAPRAGSRPSDLNAPTRKSLLASGVPTSIDACHAASIERSCSSRSATALA